MQNQFEKGQMIETEIVAITNDTIFLNLGLKSEGFLDKKELCDENGNLSVKEGDKIKVYFVGNKSDELYFTTKLSGNNIDKSLLEKAFKEQLPLEGSVKGEIKGGFEVSIAGTRAFCPFSQMGYKERKEPSEYIGRTLPFIISEFKNEGKNLIVSNRKVLEIKEQEELQQLANKYKVGDIVEGTVKSIESYGVFVELNGFQALLPASEVSYTRVSDLSQVFKKGDSVKAKIIKADWEHQRVSLSTKELESNPWDEIKTKVKVGDKIEGKIVRVADFGVFINVAPGIDGLVHISKLDVEKNTNLKKVYKTGDVLSVTVDKIDTEEKRISLVPVVSNEEQDNANEYFSTQSDDGDTYNPFAALLKK